MEYKSYLEHLDSRGHNDMTWLRKDEYAEIDEWSRDINYEFKEHYSNQKLTDFM